MKLADAYYIICNKTVDDAIYVQSKGDGKYLRFQRDYKCNLYYMDISEDDLEKHCYLNTVKEGKTKFSICDQKKVEVVKIFQERYGLPLDKDFIHTLIFKFIEGVDFSRRDVNIANKIYGYCKGATMGRFKHPRESIKMDRINEDIITPVPPEIMKYLKDIHLDIDLLFMKKTDLYWPYYGILDLSIVGL